MRRRRILGNPILRYPSKERVAPFAHYEKKGRERERESKNRKTTLKATNMLSKPRTSNPGLRHKSVD
eukprot:4684115-Amphidinium_carterae.1